MNPFGVIVSAPLLAFSLFSTLFWGFGVSYYTAWLSSAVTFPILLGTYFYLKSFQSQGVGQGMADVTEMPAAILLTVIFAGVWLIVALVRMAWNFFVS